MGDDVIIIIEDDKNIAKCIAKATEQETAIFSNAIDAMKAIEDGLWPRMIFLDVLLNGPDGFTFLNELLSYPDTAAIPVILLSSEDLDCRDVFMYGVTESLNKDTMTPAEIKEYVRKFAR